MDLLEEEAGKVGRVGRELAMGEWESATEEAAEVGPEWARIFCGVEASLPH